MNYPQLDWQKGPAHAGGEGVVWRVQQDGHLYEVYRRQLARRSGYRLKVDGRWCGVTEKYDFEAQHTARKNVLGDALDRNWGLKEDGASVTC